MQGSIVGNLHVVPGNELDIPSHGCWRHASHRDDARVGQVDDIGRGHGNHIARAAGLESELVIECREVVNGEHRVAHERIEISNQGRVLCLPSRHLSGEVGNVDNRLGVLIGQLRLNGGVVSDTLGNLLIQALLNVRQIVHLDQELLLGPLIVRHQSLKNRRDVVHLIEEGRVIGQTGRHFTGQLGLKSCLCCLPCGHLCRNKGQQLSVLGLASGNLLINGSLIEEMNKNKICVLGLDTCRAACSFMSVMSAAVRMVRSLTSPVWRFASAVTRAENLAAKRSPSENPMKPKTAPTPPATRHTMTMRNTNPSNFPSELRGVSKDRKGDDDDDLSITAPLSVLIFFCR